MRIDRRIDGRTNGKEDGFHESRESDESDGQTV